MFPKESFPQLKRILTPALILRATEWADDVNVYGQGKVLSAQFRARGCLMSRRLLMVVDVDHQKLRNKSMHRYSRCLPLLAVNHLSIRQPRYTAAEIYSDSFISGCK